MKYIIQRHKRTALLVLGIAMSVVITISVKAAPLFSVEVVGQGNRHLIFIPGLTCPGEVWKETVEQFKSNYTCHVLSLPGFAGKEPVATDHYLQTMRDEIAQYIHDKQLNKPALVGHSLGGFLALWVSATYPDLAGANLIVDALPFMGAAQNPAETPETVRPMAEQMRKMMANATPGQVRESQKYFLNGMINNPEKKLLVSEWGVKSHAPTVAQAMYELQVTDLRPALANIKIPTLVLGAWIGYKEYGMTKENIRHTFDLQFEKLPNKTIILSDVGKHFLMYDDPTWMMASMNEFLNKTKI